MKPYDLDLILHRRVVHPDNYEPIEERYINLGHKVARSVRVEAGNESELVMDGDVEIAIPVLGGPIAGVHRVREGKQPPQNVLWSPREFLEHKQITMSHCMSQHPVLPHQAHVSPVGLRPPEPYQVFHSGPGRPTDHREVPAFQLSIVLHQVGLAYPG